MRILSAFVFLLCVSASSAFAQEEDVARTVIDPVNPKDELAEQLEDFIGRAVDEGLLERAGGDEEEITLGDGSFPTNCSPIFGIDFELHKDLTEYEDLYKVKESIGSLPKTEEVKMRLTLGLYSEARALLEPVDPDSSFLFNMASLLENFETPNVEFFSDYSDCGAVGSFWHSVSLLAVHDSAGIGVMRDSIKYFRSLPLQVRVDLATIIVPALEGFGENLLARRIMATFNEEDTKNSSNLQFNLALLDDSSGVEIDEFIIRPEFRSLALRAIVQRDTKLSEAQRDLLLEEFSRIIKTESDERRITTGLKFALKEFAKRSDISKMVELTKIPNLQSPAAQNTILQKVASEIQKGLKNEDQLVVLSAIQALIDYSDTLDSHPATVGLYPVAAEIAKNSGYKSLATRLSDRGLRRVENLLQSANIAYRNQENDTLYDIARKHGDVHEITLLAAKAALKAGDNDPLKEFEVKLLDRPKLSLELAQIDAVTGAWRVSESVYAAAIASTEEATSARAKNLLNLRRAAIAADQAPEIQLSQADEILGKKTTSLRPEQSRTN